MQSQPINKHGVVKWLVTEFWNNLILEYQQSWNKHKTKMMWQTLCVIVEEDGSYGDYDTTKKIIFIV